MMASDDREKAIAILDAGFKLVCFKEDDPDRVKSAKVMEKVKNEEKKYEHHHERLKYWIPEPPFERLFDLEIDSLVPADYVKICKMHKAYVAKYYLGTTIAMPRPMSREERIAEYIDLQIWKFA